MQISAEDLKALREALGGISQEDLARRLGVSLATVNRWERGRFAPSRLAQEKLEGLFREVEQQKQKKKARARG